MARLDDDTAELPVVVPPPTTETLAPTAPAETAAPMSAASAWASRHRDRLWLWGLLGVLAIALLVGVASAGDPQTPTVSSTSPSAPTTTVPPATTVAPADESPAPQAPTGGGGRREDRGGKEKKNARDG